MAFLGFSYGKQGRGAFSHEDARRNRSTLSKEGLQQKMATSVPSLLRVALTEGKHHLL